MAKNKTAPTAVDVEQYLDALTDAQQRVDALRLVALMQELTGEPPRMWGPSIIGCGQYHYVYASGHEGDAPLAGFAPRKGNLVVYLSAGMEQRFAAELRKLGPHKAGKGCLYIKRLADVDLDVLREMIRVDVESVRPRVPEPPPNSAQKKRRR